MSKGKVLVTGAFGFFGQHLCEELKNQDYIVYPKSHIGMNLLNYTQTFETLYEILPDYIIHAAGYNGGIKFNMDYPYDIFMKNTMMGNHLIEAAIQTRVKKVVSIVTSCAYGEYEYDEVKGKELNDKLYPEDFLSDKPNPTVECHGYAKRHLQLLSKYANQQYGLNAVTACITTMYGPGDSLDLQRTKVMMALIKKFVDAKNTKAERVDVWGTGKPRRQFIFVKDAAKCVIKALENYNNSDVPVNISPSGDIEIRKLCREIAWAVDYKGEIAFDYMKPDGQMKKELIPDEMFKDFKFTDLTTGIKETVAWYQSLQS